MRIRTRATRASRLIPAVVCFAILACASTASADVRTLAVGSTWFEGIGVDGSGNLILSEPNNKRVHKLSADGAPLGMFANGGGLDFSAPSDSAVLPDGNLAIADNYSGVFVVTPSGAF